MESTMTSRSVQDDCEAIVHFYNKPGASIHQPSHQKQDWYLTFVNFVSSTFRCVSALPPHPQHGRRDAAFRQDADDPQFSRCESQHPRDRLHRPHQRPTA